MNTNIPLGVKSLELPNPLALATQAAQLQGLQTEQAKNALALQSGQRDAANAAALDAFLRNPDTAKLTTPEQFDPAAYAAAGLYAQKLVESMAKTRSEKAATEANQAKTAESKQKTLFDAMRQHIDTATGIDTHDGMVQFLNNEYADPIVGPEMARRKPLDQAIRDVPDEKTDPQGFANFKGQFVLGANKFAIENKPTTTQVNRQGTVDLLQTPGMGGVPTTVASLPTTVSANVRYQQQQENARAAQTRDATVSKPFEVTDPDTGKPVLVQQDKAGNLTPITNFGPKQKPGDINLAGGRESVYIGRQITAANEATRAIKNVGELPITTSTGWFSNVRPGTGLLGSTKQILGNSLTDQDAADYQVMMAGVERNLAGIESSGLAPSGTFTGKLGETLQIKEGNSVFTKLRKLAEVRQIIDAGMESMLVNPRLGQDQKDLVTKLRSEVAQAIPYTHHDLTALQQSANPRQTLGDFAKSKNLGSPSSPSAPATGGAAAPAAAPSGWTVKRVN